MERKGFFRFLGIFERHPTLWIAMGVFALGIGLGFYAYGVYQAKLEVLVPVAIVLAVLTWFGSATDILGLLREWYKDKKEEERTKREKIESLPKFVVTFDKSDPNTYCQKEKHTYPNLGTVERKSLRIKVHNEGGSVARKCTAKLLIKNNTSNDPENPTTEPKILEWSTYSESEEDIGINRYSLLKVIFSEDNGMPDKFAFVSTHDSLHGTSLPRPKDAFSVGSFHFVIEIRGNEGGSLDPEFRVNVTSNWEDISMERIK
jgi:hypothetical protein